MTRPPDPHPHYDSDLQDALEADGEQGLVAARAVVCRCGHTRADHWAATGALGSFGGSACKECWACGTFREQVQGPEFAAVRHELTGEP